MLVDLATPPPLSCTGLGTERLFRIRSDWLRSTPVNEIDDRHGLAHDVKQWKFIVHAQHEGGVALYIQSEEDVGHAMPMVQQARGLTYM